LSALLENKETRNHELYFGIPEGVDTVSIFGVTITGNHWSGTGLIRFNGLMIVNDPWEPQNDPCKPQRAATSAKSQFFVQQRQAVVRDNCNLIAT